MTSRLQAWIDHATPLNIWLPSDIADLEIVCSESEFRVISHIGIELCNCVFNSPALQQLRRRMPGLEEARVRVNFNPSLMDKIWVTDPTNKERIEILNSDPTTRDLSAKQVSMVEAVRRQAQADGSSITRAQARRKIQDICAPLVAAGKPSTTRAALRLLGLVAKETDAKTAKQGKKIGAMSKGERASHKERCMQAAPAPSIDKNRMSARSAVNEQHGAVPEFKVFRVSHLMKEETAGGADANPH